MAHVKQYPHHTHTHTTTIILSTSALFFCKILEKMGSVSVMSDIVEHLLGTLLCLWFTVMTNILLPYFCINPLFGCIKNLIFPINPFFFNISMISMHSPTYNTILFPQSSRNQQVTQWFSSWHRLHNSQLALTPVTLSKYWCGCFGLFVSHVSLLYYLVVSFPELTPSAKERLEASLTVHCGKEHNYIQPLTIRRQSTWNFTSGERWAPTSPATSQVMSLAHNWTCTPW